MSEKNPYKKAFEAGLSIGRSKRASLRARIEALEAERDELKQKVSEDIRRWQWLEANLHTPGPSEGWEIYRIAGDPNNPFNIQRQYWSFDPARTLMGAVDIAREAASDD